MLRRSAQSPVLAEMWVFPGGTIRPDDADAALRDLTPGFAPSDAHAAFSRPPDEPAESPDASYAYFVAAARELIEESGVLLTVPEAGSAQARLDPVRFAAQREELERGRALSDVLHELGAALALENLVYYARWITPEAVPQRFDTRFFLARLPEGQVASPSPFEMADGIWLSPGDALTRAKSGELALHFATMNHLRRLAPYRTIDELFAFARTKQVVPLMPSTREKDGRVVPFIPPELEGVW